MALYGKGRHTHKLLAYLSERDDFKGEIKCIIDKECDEDEKFENLPVCELQTAISRYKIDVVVISSYKYEKVIYERIVNVENVGVRVIKIYDADIYNHDWTEQLFLENDSSLGIEFMPYQSMTFYEHFNRYYFAMAYAKDRNVLDIACGSGYGSDILSEVALSVTGVDVDDTAIKYAKKHYGSEKCRFYNFDISELSLDKKFDLIVSFETIEHVENDKVYFEKIKEHLDENGVFIVSTPIVEKDGKSSDIIYHVNEYTIQRFKNTLVEYFDENNMMYFIQYAKKSGIISFDDGNYAEADVGLDNMIVVIYNKLTR